MHEASEWIGRTIDARYTLTEFITEGSTGLIFKANDEILKRTVAIKLLSAPYRQNRQLCMRLTLEASVIAQLSGTPHIVSLYDLGLLDTSTPFIVMEYLEGKTLRRFIQEATPLSCATILQMGQHIAAALIQLHKNRVIHRDLKPENIFYQESLVFGFILKVLDFGTARSGQQKLPPDLATAMGDIIGSPAYTAPEIISGEPIPASDIFSMGNVLYELITGKLPYVADNAHGYMLAHLGDDPLPLPQKHLDEEWPEDFHVLLGDMLNPLSACRPTAKEVLQRLRAAESQLPPPT